MWLDDDEALRAHLEALTAELARLADGLAQAGAAGSPGERPSAAVLPSRPAIALHGSAPAVSRRRFEALHRLAMVAEDQGWLQAEEAMVLRKLAFRVAFYLRRRELARP